MHSPEAVGVTSSVDLSTAHGGPSHLLHAPLSLHQVVRTGASHASHNAQLQRLLQQPVSPAWRRTHATVRDRQDQSRRRVGYLAAVGLPRDQEASQRSRPSVRHHDLDHLRVLSRESRALPLMGNTMLTTCSQRDGKWMNPNGILRCAWSWRDATVKINIRKGLWNHHHGTGQSKRRYMKVPEPFA